MCLQVRDSGGGIPEAIRDRIFDPFFTTKPVGDGMGLGLSIVQGILQAHGGEIQVSSAPGQGAAFTLCFPDHAQSGAPAAEALRQGRFGESAR